MGKPKIMLMQDEINSHTTQLADNATLVINALYPPSPLVGIIGDNEADDAIAFQNLVTFCQANQIKLVCSAKRIKIGQTVIFGRGSMFEGAFSVPWGDALGTVFTSTITDGSATFLVNDRSVRLKNFTISGSLLCDGIKTTNLAYDFDFDNIKVKGCAIYGNCGCS